MPQQRLMPHPLNLPARLLSAARRGRLAPHAVRSAAAVLRYTPFRARSLCDEGKDIGGEDRPQRGPLAGDSMPVPLVPELKPTKMPMPSKIIDDGSGHSIRAQSTPGYSIDDMLTQNATWADANAEWFKRHGHEKHTPRS